MPTPTTYASAKQVLGLAVETTQGVAVTPITFTVPVDSFNPEDKPTWLDDKAMRGSMVDTYGRVQGPLHTEFQFSGPMFPDAVPYFLKNLLGDITSAGTAPTTHAISVLNSGTAQPNSLTLVHWQGMPATSSSRTYAGACLSELTISGNADSALITVQGKGMAYPSAATGSAQTFTPSAVAPQASWAYSLGLAGPATGGTQSKLVRDFTVTITRELRVENTLQNSQSPFIIQRGKVAASGSLTFTVPSDETALNYLLNNTQPQLQILGLIGAGATAYGLTIDIQKAAWDVAKVKQDDLAMGYDTTFIAIPTSTNAGASAGVSPIKVTVTNQTAAGAY